MADFPRSTIGTILRHDARVTSYKMALLRAINDVALSFPEMGGLPIAIPCACSQSWIANN